MAAAYVASAESHRGISCGLAMEDAASVWALNYPLAPEHTIEEMLQACIDAYEHLLELGFDPGSMAIAGDQAGGWLATKVVIHFRDLGKPLPAALILLCPFLDTSLSGESFITNRDAEPFADHSMATAMMETIFPGRDLGAPDWCLLKADLSGFPPVLVPVRISILPPTMPRAWTRPWKRRDGQVRLEIWDDVPPVWHLFWWAMPEAKTAIKSVAKFVTGRLKAMKASALPAYN